MAYRSNLGRALRLAILVQSATSAVTFHVHGIREYRVLATLMVPTVVGAAAGSWMATRLPDTILKPVFGVVLAGWASHLVVRPRGFEGAALARKPIGALVLAGALAVGFYGGFLQGGCRVSTAGVADLRGRFAPGG